MFTSGFWKGIWKAFGTRLLIATATTRKPSRAFLSHFSDVEIKKAPTVKITGYVGPVTNLQASATRTYSGETKV